MAKLADVSDDYAFLLTRLAQQSLCGDTVPGAVEAAAGAVLGSAETLLKLGPEVLDAAIAAQELGVRVGRLARELEREVLDSSGGYDSSVAARALCAYARAKGSKVSAVLLELSMRESKADVEFAHSLARIRHREWLLGRLRIELRVRSSDLLRSVEDAIRR